MIYFWIILDLFLIVWYGLMFLSEAGILRIDYLWDNFGRRDVWGLIWRGGVSFLFFFLFLLNLNIAFG